MAIPARIGKYEIRGQLGMGAMGAVYQGFDPVIERLIALGRRQGYVDISDIIANVASPETEIPCCAKPWPAPPAC